MCKQSIVLCRISSHPTGKASCLFQSGVYNLAMPRFLLICLMLLVFSTHAADELEALKTAAEQGDSLAQLNLGRLYDKGEGVSEDDAEAVHWLRKAAEQGLAEAQNYLGYMYNRGEGVTQDHEEAVHWFRKAAEQGLAKAQSNLGSMYYRGEGVAQDYDEAVFWQRKAAEQGYIQAQDSLGVMYLKGEGVSQDYAKAVFWWRKAAEQGHGKTQMKLVHMYTEGKGVPKDATKAMYWTRKAAEQGEPLAQSMLGSMYYGGDGVPKNDAEAVHWFRKAAEQGEPLPQLMLGAMYASGDGVPEDDAEAVRWYHKAAEQGLAKAQSYLGSMYYRGEGVTQDYGEAVHWYRKAAEQGHVQAQYNLGVTYLKGEGVPQDYVQAYAWIDIAASQGDESSIKARETVIEGLTSAEIAKANGLSREYAKAYGFTYKEQETTQIVRQKRKPPWTIHEFKIIENKDISASNGRTRRKIFVMAPTAATREDRIATIMEAAMQVSQKYHSLFVAAHLLPYESSNNSIARIDYAPDGCGVSGENCTGEVWTDANSSDKQFTQEEVEIGKAWYKHKNEFKELDKELGFETVNETRLKEFLAREFNATPEHITEQITNTFFVFPSKIALPDQLRRRGKLSSKEKKALEKAAERTEKKRKGWHCLSSWDGSHPQFKNDVKARLNDPDSFKHDTTRVGSNQKGKHQIRMVFRARNAFGGMVRNTAIGTYDNETCKHVLSDIVSNF